MRPFPDIRGKRLWSAVPAAVLERELDEPARAPQSSSFASASGTAVPAKTALGTDPPDEPVRAAAARAVVIGVGTIDDVVPSLRQAGSKRRRCPLINEDIRHSLKTLPREDFPDFESYRIVFEKRLLTGLDLGPIAHSQPDNASLSPSHHDQDIARVSAGGVPVVPNVHFLLRQAARERLAAARTLSANPGSVIWQWLTFT